MRAATLCLAAAAVLLLAAGASAQGSVRCPLNASQIAAIDFKPASKACQGGPTMCTDCVCALVEAFVDPTRKVGITSLDGLTEEQAQAYLSACLPLVIRPLTAAGMRLTTLMQLQQCKEAPPCLAALLPAATNASAPAGGV